MDFLANIQDVSGRPTRLQMYNPLVKLKTNYRGFTKYSDGTVCDCSLYPFQGVNTDANIGTIATSINTMGQAGTIFTLANISTGQKWATPQIPVVANNSSASYKAERFFRRYIQFCGVSVSMMLKEPTPSTYAWNTSDTRYKTLGLDSSTFLIIMYNGADNGYIYGIVGQIASDGTITWGTKTKLTATSVAQSTGNADVALISSGKVAVTYKGTTNYPYVTICTISGTTITVGADTQLNTTASALTTSKITAVGTDKFVANYRLADGNTYFRCATVSGTTPTLGTEKLNETGAYNHIIQDGTDKFISYYNSGTDTKAVCGTCTGTTTITLGTPVTVFTGDYNQANIGDYSCLVATDKLILAMPSFANTYKTLFVAVTASGTTLTVNTASTFTGNSTDGTPNYNNQPLNLIETTAGTVYTLYSGNYYFQISISGTTITQVSSVWGLTIFVDGNNVLPKDNATTFTTATINSVVYPVGSYAVAVPYTWATNAYPYFTIGIIGNSYELYNNTTIIGSGITQNEPFTLKVNMLYSTTTAGDVAYFRIKNTSGGNRMIHLTEMIVEVD